MTRTAHHLSHPRHDRWDTPGGGLFRAVVLYDLRYSARTLADAERAGRHPRPVRVRRHVRVYRLPRYQHDASVAHGAARLERRARQALRARLTTARRLADAPGPRPGPLGPGAADIVDIPPALHRHSALWLA
ncbi:hypothetical protein ACFWIN_29660 [Streptomyces sp. NPDC127049]|uniref:hypothetical protein n=1 Tax=Streptomyces sp. NPDC127049 TaxID=3347118 RepID=UPI00366781ED